MRPRQCTSESSAAIDPADRPTATSTSSNREMIEQQQIMNSIMIANRNKYFNHQQVHHPQPSIGSSLSLVTKNSPSKIMSNPGVSGATNSVAAMMNNNNNTKAAPQAPTNGMSSAAHTSSSGSGVSVASPASPQQPQATANKMGSRRIFSPHFKIQVLESYRNDSDCKGNQRATARKYGIHRRQIQKWLQCETALRTSVSSTTPGGSSSSSSSGSSSNGNSPPSLCKAVDSNNNNPQKRSKAVPVLSTSSNHQARHSVDSSDATHTHARPNSMEFFSLTTTSLIINGGAAGGPDGARKIESMNEAAVPIKPEFGSSSASTSSPHPSSVGSRSGVEMPAAAMFKHQHHDLYQHHHQTPEEDAPHHSLISPFISTIYGPQGMLAFPTPRLATAGTYPFDFPLTHHISPAIPIDLSMGNAERRHSGGDLHFRHSPLIQIDDARVPSRSVSGDEVKPSSHAAPLSPIDLSCGGRKRKAVACPAEPVKPPKLFKPYLLDEDDEEEEELKVVDDDTQSTASTKEDSFLDQDLTGLKDKHSRRFENPIALWSASQQHRHQYYAGSSPAYESFYYNHENLTLYPSPRAYRYESQASLSPSTTSSPLHHPSRPSSLFDSSTSSEMAFGNYHPSSPASSDVPASPPVFSSVVQPLCSSNWAVQEMRSHIGSVF